MTSEQKVFIHSDICLIDRNMGHKGWFTYSDCESDVGKIGFIAFALYHSHLVTVNIKEKVVLQLTWQSLYVNEP